MGLEGLEPSWGFPQRILSASCLPFHHSPELGKGTRIVMVSACPENEHGLTTSSL